MDTKGRLIKHQHSIIVKKYQPPPSGEISTIASSIVDLNILLVRAVNMKIEQTPEDYNTFIVIVENFAHLSLKVKIRSCFALEQRV